MLQLKTATAIVTDDPGPEEPIRAELFGIERLEEHAESLAAAHHTAEKSIKGRNLLARVGENADLLLAGRPR